MLVDSFMIVSGFELWRILIVIQKCLGKFQSSETMFIKLISNLKNKNIDKRELLQV
jgi:hypothetical protein